MKAFNRYLLGTTFLLICFGTKLYSQGASHVIILTVNTEVLNQEAPETACTFNVADESITVVEVSEPAKDFTILVKPEDFVEWKGVTTAGEVIDIEMIEFKSMGKSKNIFAKKKNRGVKNNGAKKKVKEKVKGNAKGKEYIYAIHFTVDGEMYHFDPKIKAE
ncbi:hypothetical protein [uncultured Eudoraea sp.]|uniref:hypothetical protein n=1 Tax=uncultured Eudoraea sp. TaxID=1035614 RepID=UPI0026118748|nr:hypothetical protein [uncultured Eudoraea sp.]